LLAAKCADYLQLLKVRLTSLVVFSAVMGYLLGIQGSISFMPLILLMGGGFAIAGASNTLNQIFERDYDKKMKRTANRPLPDERVTVFEAGVLSFIFALTGAVALFMLHPLCAGLGVLALVLYAFVYTPLKRYSSLSVFAGAFPGALPVLIGWVGATQSVGLIAFLLFGIQFLWQFPHTWSIAWLLNDDYKKAGFKMLPSRQGIGKGVALQIFIYTLMLIPVSLLPAKFGLTSIYSSIIIILTGVFFLWLAGRLYKTCSKKAAVGVMLGSFLYLPIVQLALVIDKLLIL
jgi:protoheme IX farnesyltransferase